ncbi:hypothetical protein VTK56DRAFT_8780 [Thermocarpiscus australiensis]
MVAIQSNALNRAVSSIWFTFRTGIVHIRPYPLESTASRPLCPSQTSEGRTSSWVGDDQRIPGVVCSFLPFFFVVFGFWFFGRLTYSLSVLGRLVSAQARALNPPSSLWPDSSSCHPDQACIYPSTDCPGSCQVLFQEDRSNRLSPALGLQGPMAGRGSEFRRES